MHKSLLIAGSVIFTTAVFQQAHAVTIDFEGIAPSSNGTTENGTRVLGDFQMQVGHGHILDSAFVSANPQWYNSNGTDYYLHDDGGGFTLSRGDGRAFNLISFDTAFWNPFESGSYRLDVYGTSAGSAAFSGMQSFTISPQNGEMFKTYATDPGMFGNVTSVTFRNAQGVFAFDNIVLGSAVTAPDAGSTAGLLILGISGVAWMRRKSRA